MIGNEADIGRFSGVPPQPAHQGLHNSITVSLPLMVRVYGDVDDFIIQTTIADHTSHTYQVPPVPEANREQGTRQAPFGRNLRFGAQSGENA